MSIAPASRLFARPLWALLAAAALAAPVAQAGEGRGLHAAMDSPGARPGTKSAIVRAPAGEAAHAGAAAAGDPMDALREKLAQKLGAHTVPEAPTPYVMRVIAKSDLEHAAKAHGDAQSKDAPAHGGRAARRGRPHKAAGAAGHARAAAPDHAAHAPHWDYQGELGPDQWGRMKPEFAACNLGKRQSPIDIRGGVKVELEPIQFDYRATGFRVIDNGHTIQVNLQGGNSIEVQGKRWDLLQFHFHRPSEERIDGRQFDMVAHLVHKSGDGKLAVIAVLLDRGSAHPLVQAVWNNLPLEKGEETTPAAPMDVNQLLPADRRYFTYMGSLTTPPCSEGVLWLVMQQPVALSSEQIGIFAKLYPMNARPIQQAQGRLIKQSN